MIYIRMELWPKGDNAKGDNAKATVLGEATISNSGGTPTRGVYEVVLSKKGGFKTARKEATHQMRVLRPTETSVLKRGAVDGFPRKSSSAWNLLREALTGIHEDDKFKASVQETMKTFGYNLEQLRRLVVNREVAWEIVSRRIGEEASKVLQYKPDSNAKQVEAIRVGSLVSFTLRSLGHKFLHRFEDLARDGEASDQDNVKDD